MTAKELRREARTYHAHSVNRAVLLERAAVVDWLESQGAKARSRGDVDPEGYGGAMDMASLSIASAKHIV